MATIQAITQRKYHFRIFKKLKHVYLSQVETFLKLPLHSQIEIIGHKTSIDIRASFFLSLCRKKLGNNFSDFYENYLNTFQLEFLRELYFGKPLDCAQEIFSEKNDTTRKDWA